MIVYESNLDEGIRRLMRILITGVTGQDGSYLAEELMDQGHEVHGLRRRSSSFNTGRVEHLYKDPHLSDTSLKLHYGDMTDSSSLSRIVSKVAPDRIYNLAAQSHVAVSFEEPEYTGQTDALGVTRLLEIVRNNLNSSIRIYQASTSEIFGKTSSPQNEDSKMMPQSPYAAAKLYAYWLIRQYREAFDMFASNGILFNHESPRRGETFVTRKITRGIAEIVKNKKGCLYLGNLDAKRDWGHARDYARGMIAIMEASNPDDYVLATGIQHTVRDFFLLASKIAGLKIEFLGTGIEEKAINTETGEVILRIDPIYFRPNEVDDLCGDYSKAKSQLGWAPEISFENLVEEMMIADLRLI